MPPVQQCGMVRKQQSAEIISNLSPDCQNTISVKHHKTTTIQEQTASRGDGDIGAVVVVIVAVAVVVGVLVGVLFVLVVLAAFVLKW